ncbi:MAG: MFS transporter [Microcella pacifica]|uniref:MFS transporter n=1 Tax=Microcella pacifica TaxID=2591847 RepID=UPI000C46F608|nr:MFS transporter [Leifsonia sp.]
MTAPSDARRPSTADSARDLLSATGRMYPPVAFTGRLPFAMMIVGILTFATLQLDSVALAGLLAACAGVGTAISGPWVGALADRNGQRAVLLIAGAVSLLATGAFLALVLLDGALGALVIVAVVMGASTPQVAPFSRARLVRLARDVEPHRRSRATSLVMSYESVMDEVSFVIGPVIVGAFSVAIAPWAPLAVSMTLTATAIVAFALHRTAALAPLAHDDTREHRPRRGPLLTRELALLIGAMFLVGGIFGATLTALTEFMTLRGEGEYTGIAYGAMSLGAILTAGALVLAPVSFSLQRRWTVFAVLASAGALGLVVADSLPFLLVALFAAGCGVGAVLVALFSLGAEVAAPGRTTTVLTILQSTLVVGQALVTAATGALAASAGPATAFVASFVCGSLLVALALAYGAVRGRLQRVSVD